MVPLLQEPLIYPHATLITLFMNVVDENITDQERIADMIPYRLTKKHLLKHLPPKGRPTNPSNPELIKILYAWESVTTYDHIFDRFVKDFEFSESAQFIGVEMKEKHTIVEKWPFRLKLRPGQQEPRRSLTDCWLEGCQERSATWNGREFACIKDQ